MAPRFPETVRDQPPASHDSPEPVVGLILFFAAQQPVHRVIPCGPIGDTIELGREGDEEIDDPKLSRHHARVRYLGPASTDGETVGEFEVTDLGSTNGTFIDGERLTGSTVVRSGSLLRVGGAILTLRDDVRAALRPPTPFRIDRTANGEKVIAGADLQVAFAAIRRAARAGEHLYLRGESGTGKEVAARLFHAESPRHEGPFIAVNCATIAPGLAERLLFGTRKGAYSGAEVDAEGYLQAADKGTLFLDEVAELDAGVQAKLLRTLETGDVLPLGALKPTRVELRVVCATHADLRVQVAAGRFREDLYFRIGRPEVALPALRDRREEIPSLLASQLSVIADASAVSFDATFVEACCLRSWPGNVRELLSEARRSVRAAVDDNRQLLTRNDLDARAGQQLSTSNQERSEERSITPTGVPTFAERTEALREDPFHQALVAERGNVSRAAERLGVHRNRLRRWLERHHIDAKNYRA